MENLLSMKESIITYLDRSGGLNKLVEGCKYFRDSQQVEAVYRFSLDVNPSDVVELDALLGDCILHDPMKATSLFQSVCFLAIKTLSLIEHIETENQVNVVLRLTHIPPFPNYFMDLSDFPRGYGPMRPVAIEGLVIAMTPITKYTRGARFLCAEEKCPCSRGFHHIRVHAPGATESATVRNDFICFLCTSPLKEDVKSRVLGDKQLVELVDVKALDVLRGHDPSSLRYQSVNLFLRDELCNCMKIGQIYQLVGIPAHVHQWPSVSWSIEACSIQTVMPNYPCLVSDNFKALHATSASSPWRFSAIVANTFASPVVPPGLYSTLKLLLLLSLVQTEGENEEAHNHLDVLAITSDTLIIDRLMTYCLGLAARGVRHPVTGELFASLSRDDHGTGTANIRAGSALLATGGVCLLGDLTCYKRDRIDALQSVLENRAVSVFIPGKKYGEDADQLLSFPVQCNFWALTDAATPSRKLIRPETIVLGSVEMGPVPPQVTNAFGLVIQCREAGADHPCLPMTVHLLRQAISPGEPLYPASMQFTTQDYKELLAHARGLKVDMSPEAEKMIYGYYMASRRVRSDSAQASLVSVTSIKLLIALAQAHAKLNLRTRVLEYDAVIAVLLCENSITLKHGASALVIPPDATFPCDLRDLDSLQRRDLTLEGFHQQILHFVYTYAPGPATYITEE
ncbi:minichromosome maintenance domain-containing protein 2 [Electrophorus electricus]|uniref:minichromosome maintenance domain-containing protein 2 n=1 Tax=Electrophorus electricus TaxID=8005 RepID=UPI0015D0024E|nr:minichromosome maintenance domain-containing protein 2 [Electrophorus electricus]